MATKFTPGPWRRLSHRQIATTRGAGLPICEVWSGGVGIEQADANEDLIAAAPELFAAAMAAMQCIGELSPTQARVEVMQALQAAVAKATGVHS